MKKVRGFEIAKGFEDKKINLPKRKTKFSAAYFIVKIQKNKYKALQPRI